ncbi:MAG TPA: hypothetical protein VHC95_03780 [Opitutales bacterium]|nr:hypothetical protein [Opitutales bacterium]
MEETINPTRQAVHRYFWEFGVSICAYVVVIALSRNYYNDVPIQCKALLALLPVIPVGFVFAAIVRFILSTDELQRRIIVNSLALAGGATALLAITYGLLEGDILPPPSAWWTYVTFMASWLIAGLCVRRHYQ